MSFPLPVKRYGAGDREEDEAFYSRQRKPLEPTTRALFRSRHGGGGGGSSGGAGGDGGGSSLLLGDDGEGGGVAYDEDGNLVDGGSSSGGGGMDSGGMDSGAGGGPFLSSFWAEFFVAPCLGRHARAAGALALVAPAFARLLATARVRRGALSLEQALEGRVPSGLACVKVGQRQRGGGAPPPCLRVRRSTEQGARSKGARAVKVSQPH
jgi:hypothetical protein